MYTYLSVFMSVSMSMSVGVSRAPRTCCIGKCETLRLDGYERVIRTGLGPIRSRVHRCWTHLLFNLFCRLLVPTFETYRFAAGIP